MKLLFKLKIFFLVNIWSVKKRAGSTLAQYSKTLPPMPPQGQFSTLPHGQSNWQLQNSNKKCHLGFQEAKTKVVNSQQGLRGLRVWVGSTQEHGLAQQGEAPFSDVARGLGFRPKQGQIALFPQVIMGSYIGRFQSATGVSHH